MANKSGRVARSKNARNRQLARAKSLHRHPYAEYASTGLWRTVDKGIGDLVNNGDLEEKTAREYIVGYLCKMLMST